MNGYRAGVSCETVARLLGVGHCESCHPDMEMGYDTCEIDTDKGAIEVCCTVATAWETRRRASLSDGGTPQVPEQEHTP
jgi:hypothetical protein